MRLGSPVRRFLALLTLFLARSPAPAQPAGAEFRVNAVTSGSQTSPVVAAASTGAFVVAWQTPETGAATGVAARRFDASGAPLGDDMPVNTYTTGAQGSPAVAVGGTGDFVIVWQDDSRDGSYAGVFGQRYAASGSALGAEFRVNTTTTGYQNAPAVSWAANGGFVVVWRSDGQDGDGFGIYGQRFDASGGPQGAEFRVNTYTTYDQSLPSVASDPSGGFVVVWSSADQDGSETGVFGQRFASSGDPLGSEFRVNAYTSHAQDAPTVAMDGSGNVVVAWQSFVQDGDGPGIYAQRYAASGAPLGGEFRANTYTTDFQKAPSVAVTSGGDFVVTWQSYGPDGSGYGISGQRYAAAGAPVGGEFRVNTYTAAYQTAPSAAASASGFVVVWTGEFEDGSSTGIFGQRYGTSCANGDVNGDSAVNVNDVFYLINRLFAGGAAPVCSADVNGDQAVNVADVFYLINYLFAGGSPPA